VQSQNKPSGCAGHSGGFELMNSKPADLQPCESPRFPGFISDLDRFNMLTDNLLGKCITYRQLIGRLERKPTKYRRQNRGNRRVQAESRAQTSVPSVSPYRI
jgi:hypothetical protein